MKQREPRSDQKRFGHLDSIRRYGVMADIDGDDVGITVVDNALYIHEKGKNHDKNHKFCFIFKTRTDLKKFGLELDSAIKKDEKNIY